MISNQVIQNSIDELKAITKVDYCVYDVDSGKVKTTGTDGKSRILLFNINYNIEVLKNGLAVYTDDFIRQVNLDEADREALNAAYRYGKDNKKGMWDGKNPVINPSDWRKMSKEAQKEAGGK